MFVCLHCFGVAVKQNSMVPWACDGRDGLFSDGHQAKQNKTPRRKRGHWGQAISFVLRLFSFISVAVTKHPNEK